MEILGNLTNNTNDCITLVMRTAPAIMRAIRGEMRRQQPEGLSLSQFGVLNFIQHQPSASLSELGHYLGVALPTVSQMVDGLVKRELISRQPAADDRRKIVLTLTGTGELAAQTCYDFIENYLRELLQTLSPDEKDLIARAMHLLLPLFTVNRDTRNVSHDS